MRTFFDSIRGAFSHFENRQGYWFLQEMMIGVFYKDKIGIIRKVEKSFMKIKKYYK